MAGYIGNRNGGLAATAERKTVITATSGQTSFTPTGGYTLGNIHVYQNGVRLVDGTDYTATNGSTVVLTTGASTDDQIVIIAPASYHNTDSYTKAESDGVRTFNRTSTDGSIVTLQKDGTTVGSIGVIGGHPHISSASGYLGIGGATGAPFMYSYSNALYPTADNTRDLGTSGNRFRNLYLSGGVYLGGTGSANYLDDYEEGTWSPYLNGSSSNPTGLTYGLQYGTYTKIGRMVHCMVTIRIDAQNGSNGSGTVDVSLPFTPSITSGQAYGQAGVVHYNTLFVSGAADVKSCFIYSTRGVNFEANGGAQETSEYNWSSGIDNGYLTFSIVYYTNS